MKKLSKILLPLMLIIALFVPTGTALAAGTEIYYDDGEVNVLSKAGLGYTYIVRFTPPSTPAILTQVQVYCTGGWASPEILPGHELKVHIFTESKQSVYSQYCEITQGWNTIDLSTTSLPTIEGDFYVGFEFVENYFPYIGVDMDSPDSRSYKASSPSGMFKPKDPDGDYMIRATVQPPMIEDDLDIKPGDDTNSINLKSKGVIPVAILGSDTFDVTMIDPTTIDMEGMPVKTVGKTDKLLASIEDVNGDGYPDLVVKIEGRDNPITQGSTTANITGELIDGTPFTGSDEIRIVPVE